MPLPILADIKKSGVDYLFKGDVNNDNTVTVVDAIVLLRHIASSGAISMDDTTMIASDLKRDGKIAVRDVITLLQYLAAGDNVVLD